MQLGGLAGMTALTMGLGQEHGNGHKEDERKKPMDDTTTHAEESLKRSSKPETSITL